MVRTFVFLSIKSFSSLDVQWLPFFHCHFRFGKERMWVAECSDITRIMFLTDMVLSCIHPQYINGYLLPLDACLFRYSSQIHIQWNFVGQNLLKIIPSARCAPYGTGGSNWPCPPPSKSTPEPPSFNHVQGIGLTFFRRFPLVVNREENFYVMVAPRQHHGLLACFILRWLIGKYYNNMERSSSPSIGYGFRSVLQAAIPSNQWEQPVLLWYCA